MTPPSGGAPPFQFSHSDLIEQYDLVEQPVAANVIQIPYTIAADQQVCRIQDCVGEENFPITKEGGFKCE